MRRRRTVLLTLATYAVMMPIVYLAGRLAFDGHYALACLTYGAAFAVAVVGITAACS